MTTEIRTRDPRPRVQTEGDSGSEDVPLPFWSERKRWLVREFSSDAVCKRSRKHNPPKVSGNPSPLRMATTAKVLMWSNHVAPPRNIVRHINAAINRNVVDAVSALGKSKYIPSKRHLRRGDIIEQGWNPRESHYVVTRVKRSDGLLSVRATADVAAALRVLSASKAVDEEKLRVAVLRRNAVRRDSEAYELRALALESMLGVNPSSNRTERKREKFLENFKSDWSKSDTAVLFGLGVGFVGFGLIAQFLVKKDRSL